MRRIWLNGLFLPESEARVSVYDEGLMYGTIIFEMMRSFNKQIFKLEAHLQRLLDSCKATSMPINYNFHQLRMAHEDIVAANRNEFDEDDEYRTMINVSRGAVPIYSAIAPPEPWVMITVFPLKWVLKGVSRFYKQGVHAIIPSQKTIPAQFLDPKVKNRSRLHYKLAELEVRREDKEAWPLLLDDHGFITEGTGANLFIIKRERLITPEPRNCLRGISRNYVLQLAREHRIDYRERNIEAYDALMADEAFFTATPFCIIPCTRLNGQEIGNGKVGKMTQFLTEKWIEMVKCDFVEQATRWENS